MTPSRLRALVFDVDGTLADTESAHRAAFNEAFAQAGLDWHWDEPLYVNLLQITGGKERIAHFRAMQLGLDAAPAEWAKDPLVLKLHALKTDVYDRRVRSGEVALRPGIQAIIESALTDGLRLAIATTTTPINVDALLSANIGPDWARRFDVIEDGQTAPLKKPHPQVYLQAVQRLKMNASECLAFEDSHHGLRAATTAGLATIITPTRFTAQHDFSGALQVLPDRGSTTIAGLRHSHHTSLLTA